MRRIRKRCIGFASVSLSLVLGACSTSTPTVLDDGGSYSATRFNNILVIGVADDYEGRSKFERKLASELRTSGAKATALYAAAGGNKPIDREAISTLVEANGYDSVLISKVLNRDSRVSLQPGSSATKSVRKDGGAIDLFRYDYVELNEPATLDMKLSLTISTELFAAVDSRLIWAIESEISNKALDDLINEASDKIARRLKRDNLIGP